LENAKTQVILKKAVIRRKDFISDKIDNVYSLLKIFDFFCALKNLHIVEKPLRLCDYPTKNTVGKRKDASNLKKAVIRRKDFISDKIDNVYSLLKIFDFPAP